MFRVLQPRQLQLVRPHVLEEEKATAGAQDPAELSKGARLIVEPAENERLDDRVEGVVLEGEILGRGAQDCRRRSEPAHSALETADHRALEPVSVIDSTAAP